MSICRRAVLGTGTLSLGIALLLIASCGGRSLGKQNSQVDGGGFDAGVVGEFCEGAKVAMGSLVATPTAATSSRLVMDCCEGGTLWLHTQDVLGDDLTIFFQVAGAGMSSGTWVLDGTTPDPQLWVSRAGDEGNPEQQVTGWFTIEPSYPGNEPVPDPDPRADPRLMELFSSAGKLAP